MKDLYKHAKYWILVSSEYHSFFCPGCCTLKTRTGLFYF